MSNLTTDAVMEVETQYWVDMKDALMRLEDNKDFQKVILEGYFKDKAVNGVSLLAVDHIVNNNMRPRVMEMLVAVSQLQDYFFTIKQLGTVTPDEEEE